MKLTERQLATITFAPNEKEREAIKLTCSYLKTIHAELMKRWQSTHFEFEDIDGSIVGGDEGFRDEWCAIAEALDSFRWDVTATKMINTTADRDAD